MGQQTSSSGVCIIPGLGFVTSGEKSEFDVKPRLGEEEIKFSLGGPDADHEAPPPVPSPPIPGCSPYETTVTALGLLELTFEPDL